MKLTFYKTKQARQRVQPALPRSCSKINAHLDFCDLLVLKNTGVVHAFMFVVGWVHEMYHILVVQARDPSQQEKQEKLYP